MPIILRSILVLFCIGFCALRPVAGGAESDAQTNTSSAYVGRSVCARCHQEQSQRWSGSQHDLAMQEANEHTVLGDFEDAHYTYFGLTSTFYRRDGQFMVRTDGPDGKLQDYEIRYTFGVYPLQQYLIAFPGGRLQALGIAWDSRPRSEGGQRWFHLYPHERITHRDRLHWTSPDQNWNYMCSECHSTHLQKNYDPKADSYHTTWAEIDVSCEACHGPGSRHVAWAERAAQGEPVYTDASKGLAVLFHDRAGVSWTQDPATGRVQRSEPRKSTVEIETCARCHSRRSVLSADYVPGQPLLNSHLPQLLMPGLYFPDGQIQDEVYVYGSFLQSKMYQAGVTCSDCHEPHSLKLRAPGNGVCLQCHSADKYNATSHHFHKMDSKGALCAECHMPPTTYMIVDPRHDHSLRIPRPDLSVKLGTPNACNRCHSERTPEWAAAQVKSWYGATPHGYQAYAEALQAGRSQQANAETLLNNLASNPSQPAIARATALAALQDYLSPASLEAVQRNLKAADPLLRLGAVDALQNAPLALRWQLAAPLLQDPLLALRVKAAPLLAAVPVEQLSAGQRSALDSAIADYIAAQQVNADRPEANLNLGVLYIDRGELDKAESAFRRALKRQPMFVQAYVNLADLYRMQGKDKAGESLLRQALTIEPDNADVHYALGLLLVRQQRLDEAMASLAEAARLSPDNPRYSYVYAVALQNSGKSAQAIRLLEEAHRRFPANREILYALATFNRDSGNRFAARLYAEKLFALSPDDPAVRQLREQLQKP